MKQQYCVINSNYKDITDKINEYGYKCICTEKSYNVSEPIAFHADVLYLKYDENIIYISDCQKNNKVYLTNAGYCVNTVVLSPGYATESKLNMIITNNDIICNPKTCLKELISYSEKKIISVKQGYTRCSTVVLSDNDFITEDENIYYVLSEEGKNCLLLEKGEVLLEGYEYGFIGGASVYLSEYKTILFFGNITTHKNYNEIVKFCDDLKVNIDYIERIKLTDIGGAVIL